MSELDRTNIVNVKAAIVSDTVLDPASPVAIRVSPHSYFTALLLGTFFSALLFYLEMDLAGFILFGLSWLLVPFFALNDRIVFDGKSLVRTGGIPRFWSWFNASRRRLKLTDIEQVETQSIRAIKRGGNVHYRYRTIARGKGLSIAIASGGDDFRRMIKAVLPRLADNVLDIRSIELRDHLAEPKETLMRAEFSRIPSAEVLEGTLKTSALHKLQNNHGRNVVLGDDEKADELQSLANELRVSGYLLQSLEAFRRALFMRPADARLLFEFARCLHSFGGLTRDAKIERKAIAALRLSERYAADDSDLLARLGECYFQIGEWQRAGNVFQKLVDGLGENFRAARGLAEMALREGKIAHVIHHFSTASRVAETPALRRWTQGETEYFSRLNADGEYMEMEIGRVNLLETFENSKKTALRIASIAFPAIVVGLLLDDELIANIGWAVTAVSLLIWTGMIVSVRMLSHRLPYEMIESDD